MSNTELLSGQIGANEATNIESSKLIERINIEGTPFTKINEGNGWFLTMGKYKITEPTSTTTEKQLDAIVKKRDWQLLTTVIAAITEYTIEELKNRKK